MKLFTTAALVCCLASPALAWDQHCTNAFTFDTTEWIEVCDIDVGDLNGRLPRDSTVLFSAMASIVPDDDKKSIHGTFETRVRFDDRKPEDHAGEQTGIDGTRDEVWGAVSQGYSGYAQFPSGPGPVATIYVRYKPAKGSEKCKARLEKAALQTHILLGR